MKKLAVIITIFVSTLLFASASGSAFADGSTNCQPIYGGGETCVQVGNISINKTVQNPSTGQYVDNLGINDPKFSPTQTVNFQITVTNTGGTGLSNIVVKDVLPQYVDFASAPNMSFDSNTKTLSVTIDNLGPSETKTYTLQAKVESNNQIPDDQSTVCLVNQASATSDGNTSTDNAQFCIQKTPPTTTKGGLPVYPATPITTTPPTGPEALAIFALLPSGISGFLLRKKSKIKS